MYVKSKVTSKYQITIPKPLRKKLGINKGDEIIFEGEDDKIIIRVEKKTDPVKAIEGILEGEDLGEIKYNAASRMLKRKLGL